ncbi:MAG: phenylalanine--tRNA ligase subunit beta, partial [Myxococcales bacterium]|nr:phenylalanine--tRNA ligase subunit beta [Myxococcales bacterium]
VATPMEPARISLRPARVSALLGDEVEPAQIRRILEGLGVELEPEEGEALWALAPSWRPDLQREVDLIEEIARVRGYDRIPSRIPRVRPSEQGTSRSILLERRLREAAAAAGLHEAITYGFVSAQDLERARVPREAVRLLNPLSEERSVMRTSLLPGLAAAARGAQRRQAERIELFELAHTYHPGGTLPEERAMLGMLLLGERDRWIGERATFDFYDLKGALEAVLLGALGLAPRLRAGEELDQQAPFLHPRRRAEILLADAALGVLGELHPDVVEALGLEGRPLYAELRLASLEEAGERVGLRQAPSLPRHPAVTRDMALIVSDGHAAGALSEAMLGMPGGLVEAVDIFDLYRGDPVPEGHRSLAYRIRYRAAERTLTDAEVEAAHAEIAALLEARFGALVR